MTQTYTETVGGAVLRSGAGCASEVTSRLRFTLLDNDATDSEFFSDVTQQQKGWRANVLASDSENDAIRYSLEANSVFRHGTAHTNTSDVNFPGVDPNTGEILWTANRQRYNDGANAAGDQSITNNFLFHDYSEYEFGDSVRNRLDASNWSFTIRAQQLIGGQETPGQFNTNTLVIKVQPNDRPWVGALDVIQGASLSYGVYVGGGSAVAGIGRPAIQEPVASDTSTPGTASAWIWAMQDPGSLPLTSTQNDYSIYDPNKSSIDGHQDAIQVNFGTRTLISDVAGIDYLVSGNLDTNPTYPAADPTTNFPAFDAANSTPNGFYNPWIGTGLGNFVVTWAPVRIQYTLSRYIGLGSYGFGIAAEDQYGRANSAQRNIFPVFGTVKFFNSRFRFRGDSTGGDLSDSIRGEYTTSGNTETSYSGAYGIERYVFSYIPYGVSNDIFRREYVDINTTVTYGSDLFGNANAGGPGAIKVGDGKEGSRKLGISNIPVAGNGGPSAGTQITYNFGNNINQASARLLAAGPKGLGASRAMGAALPTTGGAYVMPVPTELKQKIAAFNAKIVSFGGVALPPASLPSAAGSSTEKSGKALPLYTLPLGLYTAGSWHTPDGLDDGSSALYSPNPLNEELNPAPRAAGVVGTPTGYTGSGFVQFRGGTPEANLARPNVQQVPVNPSGPYSNNEADAKVIPSNSPYLFAHTTGLSPTVANDGFSASRYPGFPAQHFLEDIAFRQFVHQFPKSRWYAGKVQSEIDYHQQVPGRAIYYSGSESASGFQNFDGFAVGMGATTDSRLRYSYTWPTIVTSSAAGYPSVSTANLFNEQDVMQVATPNMSGNARFFFTGNYPAAGGGPLPLAENDPLNYFGKMGYPVSTGVTFTGSGVTVTTPASPVHQPIHVVTDSLWVPNNADLHLNFPNAYSTPAGGGNNTEVPFSGIRGYAQLSFRYAFFNQFGTEQSLDNDSGDYNSLLVGNAVGSGWPFTPTAMSNDANANPGNISTASGDRVFFVWMKKDAVFATAPNAYATWGGSVLTAGSVVDARGGRTTAPAFNMRNAGLTITNAQISFAKLNEQLGAPNQPLNSSTSILNWRRSEFELLRNIVGAPAQFGLAARVKLLDPATDVTAPPTTVSTFDDTTVNTIDGYMQNSLVVYGIKDRGTKTVQNGATYSSQLGETGIEPGAPVLAQWWNTGNGDVAVSAFPNVMKAYATEWLPSEYVEVVHVNHNFVAKVETPFSTPTTPVLKRLMQIGLIAPKGHDLLTGSTGGSLKPVVTPVRQLYINDLVTNYADGNPAGNIGTMLDIFNGNAVNGISGAPALTAPSYKVADGNFTGSGDFTINGYSSVQLSWQPAVNDLRQPSGYIVTIYNAATPIFGVPLREVRVGHTGGIGARQVLNLPPFSVMEQFLQPGLMEGSLPGLRAPYVIKVRNVWMEGSEGAGAPGGAHSFDMGKAPFATRFPMAYADVLSGVFIVRF
ncbi:MAG: hypothetical protein IPL96_00845 [Holophagaceae bacterium]|nr:hypothetical protein [Holophagaceae bacterium]